MIIGSKSKVMSKPRFRNLSEFLAAFDDTELDLKSCRIWLDNDSTHCYKDDELLLNLDPFDLLTQALDFLGINWEQV